MKKTDKFMYTWKIKIKKEQFISAATNQFGKKHQILGKFRIQYALVGAEAFSLVWNMQKAMDIMLQSACYREWMKSYSY